MLSGHETHVLSDGSEHDSDACPEGCIVRNRLRRLLDGLNDGSIVAVRQPPNPLADVIHTTNPDPRPHR